MSRGDKNIEPSTAKNKKNSELSTEQVDLSPFKQDIDELIDEFCEQGSTTLADLKRIWTSRKFSCIYQATPSSDFTMYMQTLYAQCLGHMVSSESLSCRLGGLYCLYCIHETQPFKPPYQIYISLRELKNLKYLVIIAKEKGIQVVSLLLKRMLEKKMFYFGSVDVNEASVAETVNQLTELQNAQVQLACKMLFSNTRMEHLLHMDLDTEIGMDVVKKSLSGYAEAKKEAVKEASDLVDVQSIEHIIDEKGTTGVTLQRITDSWDVERNMFVQQTGFKQCDANKQHGEPSGLLLDNGNHQQGDDDDNDEYENFEKMLEDILPDSESN